VKLKIVNIESNMNDGIQIQLEREIGSGNALKTPEIGESAYVNMNTESNITFTKGMVIKREICLKPMEKYA
jgi:hypothetical protein